MAKRRTLNLLVLFAILSPVEVEAQSLALRYWLTPKPENSGAVEAALGDFAEWLRQEGEPWRWSVYRVVVGDELGSWVLRSGGHTWQDLDTRVEGFGPRALEQFQATVRPLLESVTLQIEQGIDELTRRPAQSAGSAVYHITEWRVQPAATVKFRQAVNSMMQAHDEAGLPYYSYYYDVMGSHVSTIRRSRNYPNWAAFEDAPGFGEPLDAVYGPERAAKIRESYGDAVRSVEEFVLLGYPALRVPGGT